MVSKREIHYVLIGVNSPLTLETKVVLPGVSTHGAMVCSFLLPESLSYLTNVTGHILASKRALPHELAALGKVSALLFCLQNAHGVPIHTQLRAYYDVANQFVPPYKGRRDTSEAERLKEMEGKAAGGCQVSEAFLSKWKQTIQDRCAPATLGLQFNDVKAVSITSAVAKACKIKMSSFKIVTHVSRDSVTFASTPEEFKFEARRQAGHGAVVPQARLH